MRTKKEINIEIGARVKSARETRNMTQENLAELMDVSPQYISDMERGVVGLSLQSLKRACIVLGVSSDFLLFGKEEENRADRLTGKCRGMTDERFGLLLGIAEVLATPAHKTE